MLEWYIVTMLLAGPVAWYGEQKTPGAKFWDIYNVYAIFISIIFGILWLIKS